MRQLKNYSQNDPQWSKELLGTHPVDTIGGYGCKLTSFADLACYYGHQINPLELDKKFEALNEYTNKELLADDDLPKAFSDIKYLRSDDYTSVAADLAKLKAYLADETISVILCLKLPNSQHFVPAVACDGTKVTISDTWDGKVKDCSAYGVTKTIITRYIVYQGKIGGDTNMALSQDMQNAVNYLNSVPLSNKPKWDFGNYEALVRGGVGALGDNPDLTAKVADLTQKLTDGDTAACNELKKNCLVLAELANYTDDEKQKIQKATDILKLGQMWQSAYEGAKKNIENLTTAKNDNFNLYRNKNDDFNALMVIAKDIGQLVNLIIKKFKGSDMDAYIAEQILKVKNQK